MIEEIRIINYENTTTLDNMADNLRDTINLQYLPPELHTFMKQKSENKQPSALSFSDQQYPWSCDIWSLGIIILEIATGHPISLQAPVKVLNQNGKSFITKENLHPSDIPNNVK